jgi:putative acetyltransferase
MSVVVDIRDEQPGDAAAIRAVNDAAFGQPAESRIIDAIRAAGHDANSLVAVDGPDIVGHILFTPMTLEINDIRAAGLAPMAVIPAFQRRGIGSRLVRAGVEECSRRGFDLVFVIGHPEFYPRFGFQRAGACGVRSEFEVADEAFMVVELTPGALSRVRGVVRYVPEFDGS